MAMRSSLPSGRFKPSQKSSSRNLRAESGNDGSRTRRSAYIRFDLPILFSPTMTAFSPTLKLMLAKLRKLLIWILQMRTILSLRVNCLIQNGFEQAAAFGLGGGAL